MKTCISPAIIMRVRELGETDLIVTFFTEDRGRLQGIAKAGRKSRKRFANCLDLCALASMEYDLRRRSGLHFLQSCRLLDPFPGLRSDFSSLSLASYMIELTGVLFPPGVPAPGMFHLLRDSFLKLSEGAAPSVRRLFFEARAMTLGGYRVNLETCCGCGRCYQGEGRAVFSRDRGGISCLKCVRETPKSPGLSPASVKALKEMQDGFDRTESGLAPVGDVTREIGRVLRLHVEYRVGRRLKTTEYLE